MGKKDRFLPGPPPVPPPSGVKSDLGRGSQLCGFACLEVGPEALQVIRSIQQAIPEEWKYNGPGAKHSIVEDLHITLLLQATNSYGEALGGLQQVADCHKPPEYLISPPVVTPCDRITENSVVCISSDIESPDILSLRDDCFSTIESYVRYPGAGHVTYAYLKGEYVDEIKKLVSEHGPTDPIKTSSSHITLKMRSGKVHKLPFK
eukprot:TRINITY_DN17106_c0_g1_i1.p1 TRINITY_DN17106_c0_g1~~TRINITY_DN17106_c0_g1_i1.p1  ORF type:complete len:205 (+),score=31.58 TRINITY_DN17106_c0_g1_i1:71-685(+)